MHRPALRPPAPRPGLSGLPLRRHRAWHARLAAAVLVLAALPTAHAGPLRDALAQRRAAQGKPALDDDADSAHSASVPAGARVQRNLAYGDDPQQRMDVYLPASNPVRGVVLMVHGGGWTRGDKAMGRVVDHKAARWLPQGLALVSINYRMDRQAPRVLDQADDAARALAAVQRMAPSWGAAPGQVLLMGHSAGAHLVMLLAADPAIARAQGAQPWAGTVSLDSAALDVPALMAQRHLPLYDTAFGRDRTLWTQASPQQRLGNGPLAAAALLVCSSRRADACPQASAFAAAAGPAVQVLPQDRSHGAINADLGQPGAYTDAVEAFMRQVGLLPPQ